VLSECLFRAFANDITGSVDTNDFIAALAVLGGKDRTLTLQFVFRVYDLSGSSVIERTKVERLLLMAYGDRLKERTGADVSRAQQQLDHIFSLGRNANNSPKLPPLSPTRTKSESTSPIPTSLHLKDFEAYQGPLDVLGGWVLNVLSVFTEPLPPKLVTLHSRYSKSSKQEDLVSKYNISKITGDALREIFFNRCATLGSKPELTLESWMEWTRNFVSSPLAELMFSLRTTVIKKIWVLDDFVEFCTIFGSGSSDQKATAIVFAVYTAHWKEYQDLLYSETNSLAAYSESSEEKFHKFVRKSKKERIIIKSVTAHESSEREAKEGLNDSSSSHYNASSVSGTGSVRGSGSVSGKESGSGSVSGFKGDSTAHFEATTATVTESVSELESELEIRMFLNRLKALVEVTLRHPKESNDYGATSLDRNSSYNSRSSNSSSSGSSSSKSTLKNTRINTHSGSPTPSKSENISSGHSSPGNEIEKKNAKHENISATILAAVDKIEKKCLENYSTSPHSVIGEIVRESIQLLAVSHTQFFPGLKDLTILACCLFGIKPSSSSKEKEFITELMVRRQSSSPQSKQNPHGIVGTEWCVINKEWWDSWCKYVGGQGGAVRSPGGSPTSSPRLSQHAQPAIIDNWAIQTRQGGVVQLNHGSAVGKQVRHHLCFS
jgi:hypothetical protein